MDVRDRITEIKINQMETLNLYGLAGHMVRDEENALAYYNHLVSIALANELDGINNAANVAEKLKSIAVFQCTGDVFKRILLLQDMVEAFNMTV